MGKGTADKVKGRVKEAAGAISGDEGLKNQGRVDQAAGKAKNALEEVVDKVEGLAAKVKKKVKKAVS